MEEEEILGVNLDELSSLFSDTGFLGGESFGWGLAPYRNVVMNDDGVMVKDDNVVLYIDALGDANLSSKMWFYQKRDPLDAYDEPEFSKDNLFVKGLSKAIPGVPPYGIIALPWYEVDNVGKIKEIKFPDDTPEGFVPCSGYTIEIGGQKFKLPNLTSRTTQVKGGDLDDEATTYFAPPGCTYMMRLPDGLSTQGLSGQTDSLFSSTFVNFKGKLKTWGNPASPFDNSLF